MLIYFSSNISVTFFTFIKLYWYYKLIINNNKNLTNGYSWHSLKSGGIWAPKPKAGNWLSLNK